tara:strand:- start:4742 stop:4993 length:252 start_codon:yes stop_codon:yes gene_type:complete
MKQGTYYSRNREKVLKREKLKRENLNFQELSKNKEYQRIYYIEKLKERRKQNRPEITEHKYNKRNKKDYSVNVKRGSFIIDFS